MLPIIMVHKELDHLNWICSKNDLEEIESVLINKETKEIKKQILESEAEAEQLEKNFKELGWVKGFIPDINILNEGEIVQTLKAF